MSKSIQSNKKQTQVGQILHINCFSRRCRTSAKFSVWWLTKWNKDKQQKQKQPLQHAIGRVTRAAAARRWKSPVTARCWCARYPFDPFPAWVTWCQPSSDTSTTEPSTKAGGLAFGPATAGPLWPPPQPTRLQPRASGQIGNVSLATLALFSLVAVPAVNDPRAEMLQLGIFLGAHLRADSL